jgi:uncharacterized protein YrrD
MPQAHIRLGDPVFSRDGRKLGTVDRLILDERRRRVKALVVHKLLQAADKIIEMSLVERVGEDGIILRINADEAARLPAFVRQGFVEVTPEAALHTLYASLAPGAGTFLAAAPVAGRHTIEDATAGVHPPPIPPDAKVSVESNVPVDYDVISSGTDVYASDGRWVGTVAEVMVDPDGNVTGFVVKEGVLFKHDVFIPVAWIADIGDKHIHLKVSAEQAEASPQRTGVSHAAPAAASGA